MRKYSGISTDFEVLYYSLINNLDYFYYIRGKYWYGNGFVNLLRESISQIRWLEENLHNLCMKAPEYDVDDKIQGNGFRSFILIFERCFNECYKFSKRLHSSRESYFFNPKHFLNEADCLVKILTSLRSALAFLTKMLSDNLENSLLMSEKNFTAEELLTECGDINQLVFYGRFQSFYYCTSMRRILQGVGVIMATFSGLYQSSGGPISRAFSAFTNGLKYILNPELRAEEIVDIAQNSSVEFLKSFWRLGESQFMTSLPRWICPKLQTREEIFIPDQPINLKNIYSGSTVTVPVPSSHIPPAPIRCLLLSAVHRKGQILSHNNKSTQSEEQSSSLLFHCHGGGFISQSPQSHEIYLRHWAKDLNIPIFSVDYSLSPEAPFPRAFEEVLLAYAWVINNHTKLGWTGEKICFVGDSAGGNILMGILLKIIVLNIRQPDAIFCAYSPLVLDMIPSPSRLLCWVDPLLPLGFMLSCLDAYAGTMQNDGKEYEDDPKHSQSGRRSRKMSSISGIIDSSVSFLKQAEWVEVEANEPPVYHDDEAFDVQDKNNCVSDKNYINQFMTEYVKLEDANTTEEYKSNSEYSLYSIPKDITFDLTSKWKSLAGAGLHIITEAIMSTSFYRNIVGPFMPYNEVLQQSNSLPSTHSNCSINDKMKNIKLVSKQPFISPLLTSDENLKQMPPAYFLTLNFDPCLDDTITFAKRLKALDRFVSVDVLDGLPHGFLNFLPFSQEAHDGSNLCVHRLKEALKI